jgi:lysophospholipase L1-like esterase
MGGTRVWRRWRSAIASGAMGLLIGGVTAAPAWAAGSDPGAEYVALGDSFQSGEGVGDYLSPTDTPGNRCHRSPHAYPQRLVDGREVPSVPSTVVLAACSGATISDLPSQLNHLGTATKLVTLGIGGNDMGFANVLSSCIASTLLAALSPFSATNCQVKYEDQVERSFAALIGSGRLRQAYRTVRERAPFARVLVVTYPRFYAKEGERRRLLSGYCSGVHTADQQWINATIRRLDDAIIDAADSVRFEVVDVYDTPQGHELCGRSRQHFLNGIRWLAPVESYHPTGYGHRLIAEAITRHLRASNPSLNLAAGVVP